jgi:hypothetical protein
MRHSDLHVLRPSRLCKHSSPSRYALILLATLSVACGATARLAVEDGVGPNPSLPPPEKSLIPTVNVIKAIG